jgi:signal transduction histidine kinase
MSSPIIVNIDDHEPARYARHRILESAGYKVYDGATGQAAFELVQHHKPSLVLLDVHLPDINGLEVCKRLKAGPQASSIVVLQISASAVSGRQARLALDNGADGYLTEPLDPDVLVATVRALMRLRAAERELALTNQRLEKIILQLERSNADLRQFARLASHDLREPLRSMQDFVGLLVKQTQGQLNQSALNHVESIQVGAKRVEALLDSILVLSEIGENPLSIGPVDLTQVVNEAVDNLRHQINDSGTEIDFRGFLSTLPPVAGDATQLVRVVQNLVSNAIKYRPSGPFRVLIECETTPGQCNLSVTDNGVGIPEEALERVFELFSHLHEETPGTGIGLAVCRRIVDLHGGTIQAQALEEGGTRVMVSLPTI